MAARGRSKVGVIFIVLALIIVIVVGAVAYFFKDFFFPAAQTPTSTSNTPVAPAVQTVDIVVLTQSVSFGQSIPDAALGFAPIPSDRYVEGLYFKTKEAVSGKRARYQLQPGTILTTGMLSESAVGSYASGQIPPGYQAISIPINKLSSVSYALQAGDHVTVIVALLLEELDPNFQSKLPNQTANVVSPGSSKGGPTPGPSGITLGITSGGPGSVQGRTELDPVLNQPVYVQPSEAQRPRIVTQVLVSDAMVLGVGRFPKDGGVSQQAQATPTPGAGGAAATPTPAAGASADPDQITIVVTPQDAVTINYILLNKGATFNLALRSAGDNKNVKTEAVTLQFLMDQYNIPFPSKLPYGLEPRIDSLDLLQAEKSSVAAPQPNQ